MTRLIKRDVETIAAELPLYDTELVKKCGLTLRQIACLAAGVTEKKLAGAVPENRIAVIPVTAGQGIIELFVQSVKAITEYIGFDTIITNRTDVDGMFEGISRGANILFLADDDRFIALNIKTGVLADNGEATGRGFAAALSGMAGGLTGRPVLVLGAGPVGAGALAFLKERGATPAVFDTDQTKTRGLTADPEVTVEQQLKPALAKYSFIIDATPAGEFIAVDSLQEGTMLSMPGIPLGLTDEAYGKFREKVVHDPLQIGVATMLATVVR